MNFHWSEIYQFLIGYANRLTPQQWVLVLCGALVLGVLCLRGYGSRSNY